jgi:hypothetical protein
MLNIEPSAEHQSDTFMDLQMFWTLESIGIQSTELDQKPSHDKLREEYQRNQIQSNMAHPSRSQV